MSADELHVQMGHIHLEPHVTFQNVNCGDFRFERDKDDRAMKIDEGMKSILVKKESRYIDNEMKIYDIIKDLPDIPKVFAVYTCTNDPDKKYKVIQYELFVPYETYYHRITTHAEMMKYFRDVFESYVSLIQRHVIHNDLKPDNVLFNPRKGKYVVSDFDSSIFAPLVKDHLREINRDFHRFFDLFSTEFKKTSLWNQTINQAMDAVLETFNIADFEKTYTPQAFAHFFRAKKTEIEATKRGNVNMAQIASDAYTDNYLKVISENINLLNQSHEHGHGGKYRRTNKRGTNKRRTNKRGTNKRGTNKRGTNKRGTNKRGTNKRGTSDRSKLTKRRHRR